MPSLKIIGLLDLEKILKVFTIYECGGHLGHVTLTNYIKFYSPFPRRLHIEFGFDWPSGFSGDEHRGRRTDDDGRRSIGIL